MKKRSMVALLVALMMLFTSTAAFADTIKIGGIAPLTGAVANYGLLVQAGVDLYIDELNANGGLLGSEVELVWMDDTGDAVEASNAYNQLVSDGVCALIGAVTTTPTVAVSSLAAADNMPMITASATAYDVTSVGGNVFRTCFLDPYQAEKMAQFAHDTLQAKRVAVLYDNTDDYSIGLNEAFAAKAEELGMDVVAQEAAVVGDADYTPQLIKIANEEPDAVFICYYYETSSLVLRQAVDVGLECTLMGADGWSGLENELQDDLSLLDNAYYCDSFFSGDEEANVQAFVAAFKAKYGEDAIPSGFNALGYDAAKIVCTAIEKAGSAEDKDAIVAAMKATDLDCVTGHITFDDHNDPIKPILIMGYEDGVLTLIERIEP